MSTVSPILVYEPSPDSVNRAVCPSHSICVLSVLFSFGLISQGALAAEENEQPPPPPVNEQQPPPLVNEQQQTTPAKVSAECRDCGVVRSIREVRTERKISRPDIYVTSPQYLDTRAADPPQIDPVISLSWGPNERPQTRVGAVGSPKFSDITYEITVRFADGRFGIIEQDDASDLHVGDRVQVLNKRVERLRE